MKTTMQSFYVNVPNADIAFFKEFVRKMGWSISNHPIQEEVMKKEKDTDIPADIMSLVGIASSISEEDIENDDRLSYLLRK
jgi:predicted lactoylglutathione lyase